MFISFSFLGSNRLFRVENICGIVQERDGSVTVYIDGPMTPDGKMTSYTVMDTYESILSQLRNVGLVG